MKRQELGMFISESMSGCIISDSGKLIHWTTITGRQLSAEDENKLKEMCEQFQQDINEAVGKKKPCS